MVLPLPAHAGGALGLELCRPDRREWEAAFRKESVARVEAGGQAEAEEDESEEAILRRGVWGGRVVVGVVCRGSVVLFESKQGRSGQLGFFKVRRSVPGTGGDDALSLMDRHTSQEFDLPPHVRTNGAVSIGFIHFISASAPSTVSAAQIASQRRGSAPGMDDLYDFVFSGMPKAKGSLSLFVNFSGSRACLVRLGSSKVVEVEWPEDEDKKDRELALALAAAANGAGGDGSDGKGKGRLRASRLVEKVAGAVNGQVPVAERWVGTPLEVWIPGQAEGFCVLTRGSESGIWPVGASPPRSVPPFR